MQAIDLTLWPIWTRLHASGRDRHLRLLADGLRSMIAASGDGNLDALSRQLVELAELNRGTHQHYFGVSMLNLAITAVLQDNPILALQHASEAIEALEDTSSRIELSSAIMTKATALMMLGRSDEAEAQSERASSLAEVEAILERADIEDSYGNPEPVWTRLEAVDGRSDLNLNDRLSLSLQLSRFFSRRGRNAEAASRANEIGLDDIGAAIGQKVTALTTLAYIAVAAGSADGPSRARDASRTAKTQGAEHWRRIAELIRTSCASRDEFAATVNWVGMSSPWNLTFVADLITKRLDEFGESTLAVVANAAQQHPGRWRFALRGFVSTAPLSTGLSAARILESIGDRSDIKRLRAYARRQRRQHGASVLGRDLARRLADRVFVEDQGRVSIQIADRQVSGSTVRRKVLALLCFLLTKPELASTRDQVLDALWPDLDPLDAVNSLNQTVYFLRRVLEQEYIDDLSPGYLHHDSDLIWLDRDLVTSRSNECRRLIKSLPTAPSPDQVLELVRLYLGRFALDFEYEEWATPYRDWLHASFLEVVERALMGDIDSGHFERGIRVARRVLDIDPGAEQIEVSLLRMYRASGAHAAAAEQYGHYASMIRDQLGVDPPPLESL